MDFETRFSETFKGPQLTHTCRPGMAELREERRHVQPNRKPQEPAAASHQTTNSLRRPCSVVDCQGKAIVQCSLCALLFCADCALPLLSCNKNNQERHNYVFTMGSSKSDSVSERHDEDSGNCSQSGQSECAVEQATEWQCRLCTMINPPHVLACVACRKTRGIDSCDGSNICPMCTLVNKPGMIKCELCETELASPCDGGSLTASCSTCEE